MNLKLIPIIVLLLCLSGGVVFGSVVGKITGEITDADVKEALRIKGEQGGLQTWYTYAMRECERACIPPHLRSQP